MEVWKKGFRNSGRFSFFAASKVKAHAFAIPTLMNGWLSMIIYFPSSNNY
jgi:hypothetical protein